MNKNRFLPILTLLVITIILSFAQVIYAASEKERLTSNNNYGDFRKAKKEIKSGKVSLQVWEPQEKSLQKHSISITGTQKLNIAYDEVWTWIRDEFLPPSVKKKGWLDIHKLYWKSNKVQGCSVEKAFNANPITGKKFSTPVYKIVGLFDRQTILSDLEIYEK